MRNKLVVAGACLMLGGCALPVPVVIASYAADILSLMTTEKTVTDHGLSLVAEQDCALHRVVTDEDHDICRHLVPSDTELAARIGDDDTEDTFQVAEPIAVAQASTPYDPEAEASADDPDWESDPVYLAHLEREQRARVAAAESRPEAGAAPVALEPVLNPGGLSSPVAQDGAALGQINVALDLRQLARTPEPVDREFPHVKASQVEVASGPAESDLPFAWPGLRAEAGAEPLPGLYYVIASAREAQQAYVASERMRRLKPTVLEADVNQDRKVFRVVVGPLAEYQRQSAGRKLREAGIKHPWAIRVKPGHWQVAAKPRPTEVAEAGERLAETRVLEERDWPGLTGGYRRALR